MAIVLLSRNSELALKQSEEVKQLLCEQNSGLEVEVVGTSTQGDRNLDVRLDEVGGKGVFVSELERKILSHEADLAVHSMKDVPVETTPGLVIHSIGPREDPADCFVSDSSLSEFPIDACIGTASLRRKAHLRHLYRRNNVKLVRGNVRTRLDKLDKGQCDGLILAAAGLVRLGLESRIRTRLDTSRFIPSAGQGVLAVQYRESDSQIAKLLTPLQNSDVEICVNVERSIVKGLGGDCNMAAGVYCVKSTAEYYVVCRVLNKSGTRSIYLRRQNTIPDQLVENTISELRSLGAIELINE